MSRQSHAMLAVVLLLVAAVFAAADCLMTPTPNPTPATATRLPLTVLPTQTAYLFAPATLVPAPTLGDLLPMTATTRQPTQTSAPPATETPVPPTPSQRPVQRGSEDDHVHW